MECVEQIVSFFKHAAQGLWKEKPNSLYLLGPVGGGKSSLAEPRNPHAKSARSMPLRLAGP